MKKSLFISGMIAIMAIVAMVAFHSANVCVNSSTLSEVLLNENIEALTHKEDATIICGGREHKGSCWRSGYELKMCGTYFYYQCEATGNPNDYCTEPC